MSEPRRKVRPGSRPPGDQIVGGLRPRLRARRRLTQAVTRPLTSTSTNAQPPSSSSTREKSVPRITNFVRNGDNWSYNYEYGGSRLVLSGTGDIPAQIVQTTPNGLERTTFSREGVPSSTIIAPPGASYVTSGFTRHVQGYGTTYFEGNGTAFGSAIRDDDPTTSASDSSSS